MLVVTISIHPGGDASRARVIEELYVWNVSSLAEVSNYKYQFELDPREAQLPDGTIRKHERSKGAWELIRRVLIHAKKEWVR